MSNIRKELTFGIFWSAVNRYSGLVMSLIISMILARILSPEEYGVVAIASVLISFLSMFCTLGIGPAIIQRDDLTDEDINSIFTFSLSIGLTLSILFFVSSWSIAGFYNNEELIPVCQILSIQLFFSAANMVPDALMSKGKRFKEIAKRTLTLQIFTGCISVVMAYYGAGIYSLLFSPVVTSIGIFIWNRMYYKVYIDWKYRLEPIKRIFAFSSYQFLFVFVNYFSRNLDKLIIGKTLGSAPLGIYEKAYGLMQLPLQNVTFVITPVLQPVLREFQNDKVDLVKKYLQIIRFVSSLSFPLGAIVAGMSNEIVHFLYGSRWDAAVPILQILSLSIPLQMILSLSGSFYLICNDTKLQFWVGIRNTVTTVIGFIIAAVFFKTLISMAWAWVITLALNFLCSFYLQFRYSLGQSVLPVIKELLRPTFIALAIGLFLYILGHFTYGGYLLLSMFVKGLLSLMLAIVLVQISGQYNIIGYIKQHIKS